MQPPQVTIVLPVHNGGAYLRETLDSVFAQTYSHFTLYVLENASTDGTLDLLRTFQDARVHVLPSDRLLSIEENWSRILNAPLAEWMTILSHDDRLHPGFLQEMVTLAQRIPDASLYSSQFQLINADGQITRPAHPTPQRESGDAFLERRHHWQADSFGTGYFMRSADYRAVGGIPTFPGLYYADDVLWMRLGNLRGKVCSPQALFDYRYYRSSSARTIDLPQLHAATSAYLNAVADRSYFRDPARWRAVIAYAARHFSRNCQRKLVSLMTASELEAKLGYRGIPAQLKRLAAQDPRFPTINRSLQIMEWVGFVPVRPARRAILWAMETTVKHVRRFTD